MFLETIDLIGPDWFCILLNFLDRDSTTPTKRKEIRATTYQNNVCILTMIGKNVWIFIHILNMHIPDSAFHNL